MAAVPVIETERLKLRGYSVDDYPAFLAMSRLPEFYRFLTPEPMPPEEVWKTLLRSAGHWALLGFGFWAIEEKATGEYIGNTGFLNLKRDLEPSLGDAPEIGWVIAPSTHGKGYATEAATAVLAWGQQHFGPVRTVCIIDPENEASLRVAAKLGYREYARAPYHGKTLVLLERPADQ